MVCLLYTSPFYRPVSYITPNEYAGIIGKGQQDKDGNMWFATEGAGLFYYNPENGRQQLYPIKPLHEGNYEINICLLYTSKRACNPNISVK